MSILVIDAGTSSVRAVVVHPDGSVSHEIRRLLPPDSPAPGLVEFDAAELASASLEAAAAAIEAHGPVDGVAIANQRATTVVWDRESGEPAGPALGWQDLRTVGTCLEMAAHGVRLAPNATATKASWLLDQADADRQGDWCVGTVDTWLAWHLTSERAHITDVTNAGATDLVHADGSSWNAEVLDELYIPVEAMARIVDSSAALGVADRLAGSPPLLAIVGDQQASLIGQRCLRPGLAKITFGTGGMLDICVGSKRPKFERRGDAGTFPIAAWALGGETTWGAEGIILSAGTNVEWLRDDLGIISSSADSHDVASQCTSTGDVWYVPALLGLGTPQWDFGARGTLLGITRGTGRPEVVRAVLEGVAHRGADLIEAAEADTGLTIERIRIDGGMSANPTFVQALADAAGRPVELASEVEATALGAGLLAGLTLGWFDGIDDLAETWKPRAVVEPAGVADRERWHDAVGRAERWYPDLSALAF